jgi:hypothetical protein
MAFTGFSLASLELMTAMTLLLKQFVSWPQFKQWLPLPPSLPAPPHHLQCACSKSHKNLSFDYGGWASLVDIEKLFKATRTIHVTL